MTSFLLPSRTLSRQLASRASNLCANQSSCANYWSRVIFNNDVAYLSSLLQSDASTRLLNHLQYRSYATKPGRPKAHTGRVTASKRKPAAARSDAKAGTPKKAAPKKAATIRKPAAKKPKRKTKSKTKPKPKSKPKRKVLTEEQKAAKVKKLAGQKKRTLKQTALLDPPKQLPSTAYTVLSSETSGKGMIVTERAKATSAQYKSLSPEEMERLNHVANENRSKNEAAYKKWLLQHTPAEIKAANVARNQLKKQAKKDGKKKTFRRIQDERLVKQARAPYTYFLMDRFASGDMKNMKISEVGALIGREWKALNNGEKKPYDDRAAKDRARYVDEYTSVYGTAPDMSRKKPI